ncbi:MAG: alpha/beta hydrolase [Clostridia bacterium]|nr:alpha/beta hydrolase [Clostridia bacterium]
MWIALVCIGVLALCVLAGCYWIYTVAFMSHNKHRNDPYYIPLNFDPGTDTETFNKWVKAVDDIPYEAVYITSRDGLKLKARYYHTADNAPVAICMHGYRSHPVKDFRGILEMLSSFGFNVLIPAQRGHGESEGNIITFGVKERFDCVDWIKYINSRFGTDTPVMLYGLSMGAATVLLACGEKELPKNVTCCIADCPYSSPKAIIQKVSGDIGFPQKAVYPFVALSAVIYGRFRIGNLSCAEAAKNSPVPILLIHGEADTFVPEYMSREIAAASPMVDYHSFPNATHAISWMADKERYIKLVTEFLQKNVGLQ